MKRLLIASLLALSAGGVGAQEYSLPPIPDSLRVPAQRAAWLLEHFWDITPCRRQEQAFVDCLTLMPVVESDSVRMLGFDAMVRSATAAATAELYALGEKYLYTHDSPFCNDGHFSLLLHSLLRCDSLPESEAGKYRWMLQRLMRNQPGCKVEDIVMLDSVGRRFRLSECFSRMPKDSATAAVGNLAKPSVYLVLYDPDCDECSKALARLGSLPDGMRRPIVKVNVEQDGQNLEAIDRAYPLRELPMVFLIDSSLRIVSRGVPAKP